MTDAAPDEILISVGGLIGRIFLCQATLPLRQAIRDRYDPWLLPASPLVRETVNIRVSFTPVPDISVPTALHERTRLTASHPLTIADSDTLITISRWDISANVRRSVAGKGVWVGSATCEGGVLNFDTLIRVLWSVLLPRAGGALIHACAVRVGQSALLLPGQSGAGKSTFAGKMPDSDDVLTDEMAPVLPDGEGGWRVFSSPFWGDFQRGGGSLRSWPLRGIVHLQKGDAFQLEPSSPAETLRRLLGCFLHFGTQDESARRNFDVATALATLVPSCLATTQLATSAAELFAAAASRFGTFDEPDLKATSRELISQSRSMLRKHGHYAYATRGGSMHPHISDGDFVSAERVIVAQLKPGNVLLYWVPGPAADEDRLVCHRLIFAQPTATGSQRFYAKGDTASLIEQFDDGKEAEVLGRVTPLTVKAAAKEPLFGLPSESRVREVGSLIVSLGRAPLSKLMGR